MNSEPPLHGFYQALRDQTTFTNNTDNDNEVVDECELPVIDLSRLSSGNQVEIQRCKMEIVRACQEWGFFQVVNHGISAEILGKMRFEQVEIFKQPFEEKNSTQFLNFSAGSYQWGTSTATCLKQLSWTEAFHVPLSDVFCSNGFDSLSLTMGQYTGTVCRLAQKLAEILAENMGHSPIFFQENCLPNTCYLRLNRYPPCPIPNDVFGLMPHTDSDFLTIVHQDEVGGLQLVKDGKWIAVEPNSEALIINIGDLFQAWSNDAYRSVEHRVVSNPELERFSIAYFLCPSYDTMIRSCWEPSVYRSFSFGEYRNQVQEDVRKHGHKVGLRRYLV